MKHYPDFEDAIRQTQRLIQHTAKPVHAARWQGMDVSKKPEMVTYEVLNHSFSVPILSDLHALRESIKPNLPWSDDHFLERVAGQPLNPGVQWANWPYAKSADRFREAGQFTHTYMERYWPKQAGDAGERYKAFDCGAGLMHGIRYDYGDLNDVIALLEMEPDTRQAYMPVWFPEDTGAKHRGRLPCSIGYHFIMRANYLHIVYQLRSCDFVRHFRDDIYLTVRLLLWVLDRLREKSPEVWRQVKPGGYTMHITSLHLFKADWHPLFGVNRE